MKDRPSNTYFLNILSQTEVVIYPFSHKFVTRQFSKNSVFVLKYKEPKGEKEDSICVVNSLLCGY